MQEIDEKEREEQDLRLQVNMDMIKHKIIVLSGKGGVGKTTVAVNLAYALSQSDAKVGIIDTDIHGPNIAKMLGIEKESITGTNAGRLKPVEVRPDLKAVSMALLGFDDDRPIIWRGPLKAGVIKQFLSDVEWGELDYLVIDSPPGTGDEPLSVCQFIHKITGSVIVTTPQDVATLDSRKAVLFSRQLNIPVIGIIENMSGLICPHCGKEINIFKKNGGLKASKELKVPFLGSVPFDPEFVEAGDNGTPFVAFDNQSKSAQAFIEIVKKIEEFVNKPRHKDWSFLEK
ncbi:MAG: Mrp/NBP35 family ATP-binding protein [Candidatus Poribacteria bacterium]